VGFKVGLVDLPLAADLLSWQDAALDRGTNGRIAVVSVVDGGSQVNDLGEG
jgi:hypothetical protein